MKLTVQGLRLAQPDNDAMMDIRDVSTVEVEVNEKEGKLWVNIDGVCRLRVQHISDKTVIKQQ